MLTGSEVDIRADSSLDYPEAILRELDLVVASVPSGMGQEREKMSRRIISTDTHVVESLDTKGNMDGTHRKRRSRVGHQEVDLKASTETLAARQVVDWLKAAISDGKEWPRALLEAVGRWPLPEEEMDGEQYHYLLLGEAFDWLTLAGRLLGGIDGLVPQEEKEALLFQSRLPKDIPESEFRSLLGPEKYRAHLNYFYGVVAEESLLLAVEEEIAKERAGRGLRDSERTVEQAHQRLYGDTREALLRVFRQEMGRPDTASISLTELKEFTYWLFKRRVNSADSSRVASDTKKGLERLFRFGGPIPTS